MNAFPALFRNFRAHHLHDFVRDDARKSAALLHVPPGDEPVKESRRPQIARARRIHGLRSSRSDPRHHAALRNESAAFPEFHHGDRAKFRKRVQGAFLGKSRVSARLVLVSDDEVDALFLEKSVEKGPAVIDDAERAEVESRKGPFRARRPDGLSEALRIVSAVAFHIKYSNVIEKFRGDVIRAKFGGRAEVSEHRALRIGGHGGKHASRRRLRDFQKRFDAAVLQVIRKDFPEGILAHFGKERGTGAQAGHSHEGIARGASGDERRRKYSRKEIFQCRKIDGRHSALRRLHRLYPRIVHADKHIHESRTDPYNFFHPVSSDSAATAAFACFYQIRLFRFRERIHAALAHFFQNHIQFLVLVNITDLSLEHLSFRGFFLDAGGGLTALTHFPAEAAPRNTLAVAVHTEETGENAAQMSEVRHGIVRVRKQDIDDDQKPYRMADFHRNDEEQKNHPVREEPRISDEHAHQRARSADDQRIRIHQMHEVERNAEKSGKDRGEQIQSPEPAVTDEKRDIVAEHPQGEHIEQEMPHVHMDERIRDIAPPLRIKFGDERSVADEHMRNVDAEKRAQKRKYKYDGIDDKQDSHRGSEHTERLHSEHFTELHSFKRVSRMPAGTKEETSAPFFSSSRTTVDDTARYSSPAARNTVSHSG